MLFWMGERYSVGLFMEKGEPESNFNDFEASESCDSEDVNTDLYIFEAGSASETWKKMESRWLNYQGTE